MEHIRSEAEPPCLSPGNILVDQRMERPHMDRNKLSSSLTASGKTCSPSSSTHYRRTSARYHDGGVDSYLKDSDPREFNLRFSIFSLAAVLLIDLPSSSPTTLSLTLPFGCRISRLHSRDWNTTVLFRVAYQNTLSIGIHCTTGRGKGHRTTTTHLHL